MKEGSSVRINRSRHQLHLGSVTPFHHQTRAACSRAVRMRPGRPSQEFPHRRLTQSTVVHKYIPAPAEQATRVMQLVPDLQGTGAKRAGSRYPRTAGGGVFAIAEPKMIQGHTAGQAAHGKAHVSSRRNNLFRHMDRGMSQGGAGVIYAHLRRSDVGSSVRGPNKGIRRATSCVMV